MSTEATGDGQTDAAGAVEPEVAAQDAGTSATVVAAAAVTAATVTGAGVTEPAAALTAWDTAPSAWGAPEPTDPDADEAADPDAGEAAEPDADKAGSLVPSRATAFDEAAAAGDPVPDRLPAPVEAAPDEAALSEAAPDEDGASATGGPLTADAAPDSAETAPETALKTAPETGETLKTGEAPEADGASERSQAPETGEASEADGVPEADKNSEAGETPRAAGAVASQEAVPAGQPARDAAASEAAGGSELTEPAEPGEPTEPGEPGELGVDDESYDGESDEPDEGYDDYADGEVAEYYETYQEYDEPDEAAAPPRARRWPRVLLALGFVVLAAVIVGGAVAIVGSVTHGFKKPVKVTYTKSALFSLKTGECFDPQGQSYSLVSCDSPHVAEVFATFKLSGSKWPGTTAVAADASSGCATRLTGYLNPQLAISLSSTYVYPDSVAWQAGTRTVICEVRATSGELTGSVRGASATAG